MLTLLRQRNILILTTCQVLFWTTLMGCMSVISLAGAILAPSQAYATIPAGFLALSGILVTGIASIIMQHLGRRIGFLMGGAAGVIGSAICVYSLFDKSFILLCVGSAILGAHQAIGMYQRLAAADAAPMESKGQAISLVMSGGVLAAIIAPTLSVWSQDLMSPFIYAGTFVVLGMLAALMFLLLALLEDEKSVRQEQTQDGGRPLSEIIRQPAMIMAVVNASFAQGIMVLVMLSMPLAMVACGFSDKTPITVMQMHFLAMFVPSFFTGSLITRYGAPNVAMCGAAILLVSVAVAMSGISYYNFSIALILLGVGWNFMQLAGTTMVTYVHRPEERGKVQGTSEMIVLSVAALASFSSGAVLNGVGWSILNLAAVPMLVLAIIITWYFGRSTVLKPA